MMAIQVRFAGMTAAIIFVCTLAGCGGQSETNSSDNGATQSTESDQPAVSSRPKFTPLDLNAGSSGGDGSSKPRLTGAAKTVAVKKNLRPLVRGVIGKWNGTIFQKAGVEKVDWVYDVKTDETHPALKMTTKTGGYLKEGRLTYLPDEEKYEFTAIENDGTKSVFLGEFFVEPHDVVDGVETKIVQRAYTLILTRDADSPKSKLEKVVFNQLDNGRYLLELHDKRRKFDTINTMREGRTFGVDEGYGEKECIISQGLGTISIPYKGKTYWVCCSGCKAEFDADPDKWIAKYAALKKMEK
jgi:hypothetical protein